MKRREHDERARHPSKGEQGPAHRLHGALAYGRGSVQFDKRIAREYPDGGQADDERMERHEHDHDGGRPLRVHCGAQHDADNGDERARERQMPRAAPEHR